MNSRRTERKLIGVSFTGHCTFFQREIFLFGRELSLSIIFNSFTINYSVIR